MNRPILYNEYGKPISQTRNRVLASGYSHSAASLTKPVFKGWNWSGGSPDDDIVANLPIIRQRSRQLTMDAPIIAGLYETLATYTVGTGLVPEPVPDADFLGMDEENVRRWKNNVLRYWKMFAESPNCDTFRRDNFYELTKLVCRAADESGDVFVTMPRFKRSNTPFDLKIQVVEADCVADPDSLDRMKHEDLGNDIFGGVEISQWGNVVGYWFYTGHPLASRKPKAFRYNNKEYPRWIFIPAYGAETGLPNVLHIMKSLRPGQRRGLPLIAPVIELALTLDRYMKAEAIAAQIQAMFTLVVTSSHPEAAMGEMEAMQGEDGMQVTEDNDSLIALGPGIVQYARPGEQVTPVHPTRPTTAFASFMETTLQMMGSVTLPYELLVQKFGQSYSASMASMNMSHTKFKVRRSNLVSDFCQPIYAGFMDEAVVKGWIDAPGYFDDPVVRLAYQGCKWAGIGMPQVNYKDAIVAAEKTVANGFSTGGEQSSELNGSDYMENLSIRAREVEAAKAAGLLPVPEQGITGAAVETTGENDNG